MTITGPYIQFSGAVFTDRFIVQPFTDMIYLGGSRYTRDSIVHVAKIFSVFRDTLRDLRSYYKTLTPCAKLNFSRLLPQPLH